MTEQVFTLTGLTLNDANTILAALAELSIKTAADTYSKVRTQLVAATEVTEQSPQVKRGLARVPA